MGNTVILPTNSVNMNAAATYTGYAVTTAITTGAAVANTVSKIVYLNSTGSVYVSKGTSTGTSLSTGLCAIVMTSAVFNPLSLDGWTGAINLQATTGTTATVVVETVYLTAAST